MMYIGRIITKEKKVNKIEFVEQTDDETKLSNDIPTLIIGKSLAEQMFGKSKIKVLNKNIEENVSWTFSKTERRVEYDKDIYDFNNKLIAKILNSVKYHYIDIVNTPFSGIKGFIKLIKNEKRKVCYFTRQHLYIYYDKWVFGISLDLLEYMGISKRSVYDKIKKCQSCEILHYDTFVSGELRKHIQNKRFIVPYIWHLKH